MRTTRLGIIGTGNMAEAIISGLLRQQTLKANQIYGYDVNQTRLNLIQKKYHIKGILSLTELVQKTNLLLLAVKPQQFPELMEALKPLVTKNHLLISIAAGIDTTFIQKKLKGGHRIIRVMPNTPALIGLGSAVFYANHKTTRTDRKIVQQIFSSVGIVFEVRKEKLLDAVTALSGSGPAFAYLFIDSLAQAAIRLGLQSKLALALASQTVKGASGMIEQTGELPATLISKVTSKGGTTLAGLKVLREKKFGGIVNDCVKAAARRAEGLRQCHS